MISGPGGRFKALHAVHESAQKERDVQKVLHDL